MPSDTLDHQQIETLIESALAARGNAYARYSKFRVGAAVLTANKDRIYQGCNVENASYGLSLCAERVAICSAITDGATEIVAVAITASPVAMPCGACRQFIHEFGGDIKLICVDADRPEQRTFCTISDLIPDCFSLKS